MSRSTDVLNPDALRILGAIARAGSFAGAARELGLVPSALTYRVRQIEEALDVLLFDRSRRQARPTPAGSPPHGQSRRRHPAQTARRPPMHPPSRQRRRWGCRPRSARPFCWRRPSPPATGPQTYTAQTSRSRSLPRFRRQRRQGPSCRADGRACPTPPSSSSRWLPSGPCTGRSRPATPRWQG